MFKRLCIWMNRVFLRRVKCACGKWAKYTVDKDHRARGYVCYSCGNVSITFANPPKEFVSILPWGALKYMGIIRGQEKHGDS